MARYLTVVAICFLLAVAHLPSSEAQEKPSAAKAKDTAKATKRTKLEELQSYYAAQAVINLSTASLFKKYALSGPRNYTLIIFFGSESQDFPCQICQGIQPSYERVAQTRRSVVNPYNTDFFFAYADVANLKEFFNHFQGRVHAIPTILHLPATTKSGIYFEVEADDRFNMNNQDFSPKAISEWVFQRTKVNIPVFDFPWHYAVAGFVILLVVTAVFQVLGRMIKSWRDPVGWWLGAFTIFSIMIAGAPYILINNPPAFVADPYSGSILWYMPRGRGQFKVEGIVASIMSGLITGIWILSVEWVPKLRPMKARGVFYGMLLLFFALGLGLFQLFLIKNPFYPSILPRTYSA